MSRRMHSPVAPPAEVPARPLWLRQGHGQNDPENAVFFAGSALALLNRATLSDDPVGSLWRQRLALSAAVAVSALEGRNAGETQLRDALALCRPGDDPGPAGRLLLGWRLLGEARALRSTDWPLRLPAAFDLPPGPAADLLRDLGGRLSGHQLPLRFAAEAAQEVLALGPAHRGLALWIADALLARALGWRAPVPLLAAHLPRAALRLEGQAWLTACALAWGKGAISALDLYAQLLRRAEQLRTASLRRQGKDAVAIFAALQSQDAMAAQAGAAASARAARRLFDRLISLGLVRELTGRTTFRLYGL